MAKKLIYAVDDEEPIRELFSVALENSGFEILCFVGSNSFYKALDERLPDLILLDIMLDGEDGYQILEHLRSKESTKNIPVIMISAKGEEFSTVKALNMGADDYMHKPFGVMELIARINAKLRKLPIKQESVSYAGIVMSTVGFEATINDCSVKLSLKEYNLLKYLIENNNKVLSRDKIFATVWGDEQFVETRTLDVHIAALRKILEQYKCDITIETVRGVGYILQ